MRRGLVLAGGGVAGIAWEIGLLAGIREGAPHLAPPLSEADLTVGTSAGSVVAAALASGTDLDALLSAQLDERHHEIFADFDLAEMVAGFTEAIRGASSPNETRQRIGSMALRAKTVPEAARRAVIAARLSSHEWPPGAVLITAIDVATGELEVFDRNSGVPLVDAVAASCAVPGVWPPVTIGTRRFMDGGMRSVTNADLATGMDRVLVVTTMPPGTPALFGASLDDEVESLQSAAVHVVHADASSIAAFGTNPLDPETRRPAALAGLAQGRAVAAEVAAFWS